MLLLKSKVRVIVGVMVFTRPLSPPFAKIIGLSTAIVSREFNLGAISIQALDALYDFLKSTRIL